MVRLHITIFFQGQWKVSEFEKGQCLWQKKWWESIFIHIVHGIFLCFCMIKYGIDCSWHYFVHFVPEVDKHSCTLSFIQLIGDTVERYHFFFKIKSKFNRDWHHMLPELLGPMIHYYDVIMGTIASQITSLTIVYSEVYSGADQRKPQSTASLTFVWRIHRWLVNSLHKWPVTWKMVPFDYVIMLRPGL